MATNSPSSSPQPLHFHTVLSPPDDPPASPQRLGPLAMVPPVPENHLSKPHPNGQKFNSKGKKRVSSYAAAAAANPSCPSSSSSSCSSSTLGLPQSSIRERSLRVNSRRRNPGLLVRRRFSDVEAIAYPLGMSIAAFVAQLLEHQDAINNKISVHDLSQICTSAVRESLANVYGNKFEAFATIFEKSFGSTLSTLRLIKDSTKQKGDAGMRLLNYQSHISGEPSSSAGNIEEYSSKTMHNDVCPSESEAINSVEQLADTEDTEEAQHAANMTGEVFLNGQSSRALISSSPNTLDSFSSLAVFNTLKNSVVEQTRANDLKTFEIGLIMRKLQLKETQLALNSESNYLERFKLFMGISNASFKAEKLKGQLEETRHAELLRKCIDCLVAGLLIMSASLACGTYIYSYQRITEATASCGVSMEPKSWWFPKPMASLNSGMQTLRCHVQVLSRMSFGFLMILAVTYLLVQRASVSRQTMPVTFILLLLGIGCGFAGKLCLDTLGGSGYHWLMYWEILCAVHFFANTCTSVLFNVLHGPVSVSPDMRVGVMFPYWLRRILFYLTMLLVLPLLCGLMPFAGFGEWKDHLLLRFSNDLLEKEDEF